MAKDKLSSDSKLQERVRGQIIMLTAMFLLGMLVNLVGLPDEAEGFAKVASIAALALHVFVAIGLLTGSVLTLKLATRAGEEFRKPARFGFVGITLTFAAGVLTMTTGNDWWSYVMAAGFIGSLLVYGSLYALIRSKAKA